MPKKQAAYRSAKTGRFVKKGFAAHHPATTETEHYHVRHPRKKNK